jgi:glyoxylase-like metal-dependent hydrolase (beta-lactamase superfamily II)
MMFARPIALPEIPMFCRLLFPGCRYLLLLSALTVLPAFAEPAPAIREVARADDDSWSVESMGKGVYLFRWWPGFYVSPFLVGDDAVLAVDPINREAAAHYRMAVAAVTPQPIRKILYSHDHRDHIVGADVLAPEATILAHPGTLESLRYRGDSDVPLPTVLVDHGDRVEIGGRQVKVYYFGPNHGRSNIALEFETADGGMLAYVDTLEVGIVPYRTLPDTNIHGYIASLQAASELEVKWVLGGHSGPGPASWIDNYLNYFLDMKAALAAAADATPQPPADSVSGVIEAGELHTDALVTQAVAALRPSYGHWRGFDAWAPMNAQTVWMHMITGN